MPSICILIVSDKNNENEYYQFVNQIYLFTGENSFRMREEKRRWISEFVKKYGEDSLSRRDAHDMSVQTLLDEISVLPFLSEKRLIVVDGIPKMQKEDVEMVCKSIHPAVILVFVDQKPDKRSSGVKALIAIAEVKEFTSLQGKMLLDWLLQSEKQRNLAMEADARECLIEFVGEDQEVLSREIEKLSLYARGKVISKRDIEQMVIPSDEGVIWKISDLLCVGSRNKAFLHSRRMLDRGGDPYGMWAILLSIVRNLVAVNAAMDAGHSSAKDIADASGVHIFAVRSMMQYAKRMKNNDVQRLVEWASDADVALKTGALRSTDDSQQELLSLIDLFLLKTP